MTEVLRAVDALDVAKFISFLDEACELRAGSGPAVIGRGAIAEFTAGLFASVNEIYHDVHATVAHGDKLFIEGTATYYRKAGFPVTLPFVDVIETRDGKISRYLIYCDFGPMQA
jgi:ketosteroid isomerase-like protein